jgi:hypothetical protein
MSLREHLLQLAERWPHQRLVLSASVPEEIIIKVIGIAADGSLKRIEEYREAHTALITANRRLVKDLAEVTAKYQACVAAGRIGVVPSPQAEAIAA